MKELFIQYKGILKDLLRYGVLKTEALEHTGLYNGKLGMTILFYEYSRYSGDALYEQFADEILESIMELPDDLSLDLSDGLCGIGWGITYLLRERFITGGQVQQALDLAVLGQLRKGDGDAVGGEELHHLQVALCDGARLVAEQDV